MSKLSAYTSASALDGSEVFPVLQSGANKKTAVSTILTWIVSQALTLALNLTITRTAQAGVGEVILTMGVSDDATAKLEVKNVSSTDGQFNPALIGTGGGARQALYLWADGTADTGTSPIMVFNTRAAGATPATRPLYSFQRNGTELLGVSAAGLWSFVMPAVTSTAEQAIAISVSDNASGRLYLENFSNVDAAFFPCVRGVESGTNQALTLIGQGTTDSGGSQLIVLNGRIGTGTAPSTRGLLSLQRNGSGVWSVNAFGKLTIAPIAVSTTATSAFRLTAPADTNQTASTEINDVIIDLSATKTWSTGAITTQRHVLIKAPTIAFNGASVVSDAATVAIDAAPTAGTNATITRSHAFWVQSGITRLDGRCQLGAALQLKSYTVATLPTGQTGDVVWVTDAAGSACAALYNGSAWKRCDACGTTVT